MKLAILLYVASIAGANLLVAQFGPAISPVLGFFLIGLDLSLRDWLHFRIKPYQMFALIAVTGVLTYLLNPAAGQIAMASAAAFCAAALADWAVFSRMKGTWLRRANGSNLAGAAVDSLVFPTLAFGVLMPHIVILQFVAKVAGGYVWSLVLRRLA